MTGSSRKLRRFFGDSKGAVSIIVALALPVLTLLSGGAVDYARSNDMRAKLQTAVDAALLATLSHKDATPGITPAQLKQYFQQQLKLHIDQRLVPKGFQLTSSDITQLEDNQGYRAEATGKIEPYFLRLANINEMQVKVVAEAKAGRQRVEVAMVLDVTGSMNARGKLNELKRAAKAFIRTLYRQAKNQDPMNYRVAIVPFSHYVNVGRSVRNASWIDVPNEYTFWKNGRRIRIKWEGCVGSRDYPYNVKDEAYNLHKVPGVTNYPLYKNEPEDEVDSYRLPDRRKGLYDWNTRNYCPGKKISPLKSVKNEKRALLNYFNNLTADGWTYIPAGLIWGWRVLSHKAPYTEGASDDDVKEHNVRKIILLMTDGTNTRAPFRSSTRFYYKDHQSDDSDYANELTRELCDNIKAINPVTGRRNAEIVAVLFDIEAGNSGVDVEKVRNLMNHCATMGVYEADVGELTKVFRNIAGQIMALHLSR